MTQCALPQAVEPRPAIPDDCAPVEESADRHRTEGDKAGADRACGGHERAAVVAAGMSTTAKLAHFAVGHLHSEGPTHLRGCEVILCWGASRPLV